MKQYVLNIMCVCVCVCVRARVFLSQAACKLHIVFSDLAGSNIFFHIISLTARISEENIEHRSCVLIRFTNFAWNIHHSNNNSAGYYHKCTKVLR